MIVEPLDQLPRYFGLHPLFQKADDFLNLAERQGFPEGRYPLDGEKLIAIVSTGDREIGAQLEAHRRYIDIQYIMSGVDRIGWRPVATCQDIASAYAIEQDKIFFADAPAAWIDVPPGCFAIFFPNDAHVPLSGEGTVKKVILKVELEPRS
jgi:biofilm protein TabA